MLDRRSVLAVLATTVGVSMGAISTIETARGEDAEVGDQSPEGSSGDFDGMLMVALAIAALASQTRRAYEATRRRGYRFNRDSDPLEQS